MKGTLLWVMLVALGCEPSTTDFAMTPSVHGEIRFLAQGPSSHLRMHAGDTSIISEYSAQQFGLDLPLAELQSACTEAVFEYAGEPAVALVESQSGTQVIWTANGQIRRVFVAVDTEDDDVDYEVSETGIIVDESIAVRPPLTPIQFEAALSAFVDAPCVDFVVRVVNGAGEVSIEYTVR